MQRLDEKASLEVTCVRVTSVWHPAISSSESQPSLVTALVEAGHLE